MYRGFAAEIPEGQLSHVKCSEFLNIIEGLNRQYRKVTKTKSVFPSDVSLEKMLYLASENVIKKWTQRYRNWDQVLNQLIVLYGERLTQYL